MMFRKPNQAKPHSPVYNAFDSFMRIDLSDVKDSPSSDIEKMSFIIYEDSPSENTIQITFNPKANNDPYEAINFNRCIILTYQLDSKNELICIKANSLIKSKIPQKPTQKDIAPEKGDAIFQQNYPSAHKNLEMAAESIVHKLKLSGK